MSLQAPHDWNADLLDSRHGNVTQTTNYAEYCRRISGKTPVFISAFLDGRRVGQILLLKRPLKSYLQLNSLPNPFRDRLLSTFVLSRCVGGPVISDDSPYQIYSEIISAALQAIGRSYTEWFPPPGDDRALLFMKSGFRSRSAYTIQIDLTKPLPALWAGIEKKSGRKNVERATERGVAIYSTHADDEIRDYVNILNETRIRSGIAPRSVDDIQTLMETLHPHGYMDLFLARYRNRIVAGILISNFNKCLVEWGAAHSTFSIDNHLYANDLLKWKIVEWGVIKQFRLYDLSGIEPESRSAKDVGILRFKSKWGGTIIKYHTYAKPRAIDLLRSSKLAKSLKTVLG